ncbi:hypothetical protein BCR36DRAFT_586902 [Piromyces finnis]|uniref:P-loop containing nucleoside triphosphate hydrolase protein n=1 Tax=Piromyces finnis TaxID=1754191 RepID=A0A1Y1UXH7_9FUNG|nr:hypothetical protein BCR36DRAFT_586902 [Piromyces finnis]|eukprot:ORX42969.1 hypothetical protein BCR36DRAFT_586902 [Piromyces finnis]
MVKGRLRSMIYNKFIEIGPNYHEVCPSSEIVQLSTEGVDQLEIYFGKYIAQFFYALLAPLTLFIVVVTINWLIAIVLLICVPLIPVSIIIVQKFAKRLLNKYWGHYTELGDSFLEYLQGLTTMKIYQADDFYADKMHKESEKFRKITMRVLIMQLNSVSVMDLIAYGGSAIGIILSLLELKRGHINIAEVFFITMTSSEFFLPMRLLGSFFHIAMNGNSAAERVFNYLDFQNLPENNVTEDVMDKVKDSVKIDINSTTNNNKKAIMDPMNKNMAISLENISFTYKNDHHKVLDTINMNIKPKSFVGIVGVSGCGKSTITSLIMGEHKYYDGNLFIWNRERSSMIDSDCMRKITRVTHDSYMFSGTVFDNLFMGVRREQLNGIVKNIDIEITDIEMKKITDLMKNAMKKARIYDFIMNNGGLNMKIMENGTNLSGGQKQRLALARAILHDSEIYIFDEATSNIDIESEKKCMDVIRELAKEKTVIVISHRLANITEADQIFMLDSGKIVAQGTHDELMSGDDENPYKIMFTRQKELERYTDTNLSEALKKDYEGISEEEDKLIHDEISYTKEENKNDTKNGERKRSGISIMVQLITLVAPMMGYMVLAIILGCLGHFSAIFITVLGGYGMIHYSKHITTLCIVLIILAVCRGFLRYGEQACNHYIAFKLLARIRDIIFDSLRRLAPAKLDGKKKGSLISMITSDTEQLEVFYAHTISPIAIAIITSVIMVAFIWTKHWILGSVALLAYLMVGVIVPVINSSIGGDIGFRYREGFAHLNTLVLDNLLGMGEIIQYGHGKEREKVVDMENERLGKLQKKLNSYESTQTGITNTVIMAAGAVMTITVGLLSYHGKIEFGSGIIAIIAMMSSFGPTAAISSLSNNLNHTLASGERVLDLIEETPITQDIMEGSTINTNENIKVSNVTFSYPSESQPNPNTVLTDFSTVFEKGKITGIIGKSGCGKSTVLKLLMRFYQTHQGSIYYGSNEVNTIKSANLRRHISYVTQETYLFHDTIASNLRIAKLDATDEEIIEACKKASIHERIQKLSKGYETKLSELGKSLSGGERQRIGIARAFLSQSDIIFLDEPTSNLDSLNEAVIIKSLKNEAMNKTIIIVSHRKSTLAIADRVIKMKY